jgi:hypothetical protein
MVTPLSRRHCPCRRWAATGPNGLKAGAERPAGLEFGPRDLPLAEDREWIRGIVAVPLHQATDAALQALVSSVSQALERAPNHFLDRYEQSQHLQDLGIE